MRRVRPKLAAGSRRLRDEVSKRGMIPADLVRAMREFDIPAASTLAYYNGYATPPVAKMELLATSLGLKLSEVLEWYYPKKAVEEMIEESEGQPTNGTTEINK